MDVLVSTPLMYNLLPEHQLLVAYYLKHMNKARACEEAGLKSQSAFSDPDVKAAIAEEVSKRASSLLIGSDYVLREAIKVYDRCMELQETYNPFEPPDQQYRLKFDASNALKALTIIGKHTQIQAFQQAPGEGSASDNQIMERLLRGRQRRNELEIDDDVIDDEEDAQVEQVSFLNPPESFLEPKPPVAPLNTPDEQQAECDEHYESAEYDSDAVHEIEPAAEEKLAQLMERWKTGKPPGKKNHKGRMGR